MKSRIIVALVFVPLLFVVLFFLPPYALAAVIALVCAVSAFEMISAIGAKENKSVMVYAVVSAILIPAGVYFGFSEFVFMAIFLLLMCVVFIEAIISFRTNRHISFAQILTALFAGTIIPLLLSTLVSLKNMQQGHLFVLLPIVSTFITDAGAYFVGVFLGKHNAFPQISPKKTVEGFLGGIAIGTAAVIIYGVILKHTTPHEVRFWALAIYGFAGAVVTELGDLAFSLIKREFDIKDFGRILPGHGGMLDRFDSMVFAAPAMYLMVSAIPAVILTNP